MKTYSLFVMIHPGDCEEWPCIAGIYELQLGNSHHIWVFIYAYSYINVKLGHSATILISWTCNQIVGNFERNEKWPYTTN